MAKCDKCGKTLEGLPYTCRYCGKTFCAEHQLPENHNCEGLKQWQRGELKKFKKEIKSREYTYRDILRPNPLTEPPVSNWLNRKIRGIKNFLKSKRGKYVWLMLIFTFIIGIIWVLIQ